MLEADLPGVTEDNLFIQLEDNVLSLHARIESPGARGCRALHEEYRLGDYYRSFILSDEVDRERITAELRNGVLRLDPAQGRAGRDPADRDPIVNRPELTGGIVALMKLVHRAAGSLRTRVNRGNHHQPSVNALPPLKVVQLLGNACLSPTTLAPKDPFRSCVETALHELFSLFSEEPHWVIPNEPVGKLGAMPAAWLATVSRRCHSVDVFQRGRFLFPRQPPNIPITKELHLESNV